MSQPLTVTADLSTPLIGVDRSPMMLDAPLSWAYAERARSRGEKLPPLTTALARASSTPI